MTLLSIAAGRLPWLPPRDKAIRMRRWMGQSPTQYVNYIRMTQAARTLTCDSEPMAEVAAAVGIANLSHFHKLFRSHHGMTPLQYRQQFQRDVVQPST